MQLGEIVRWLSDHLPDDAIVANGAGNYCVWVNGYYRYRGYRSQLGPTSGSMGYGTPAAIAAKLVHPERTVVCFAGDGCFLMTGQELATAAQYDLPVIWIAHIGFDRLLGYGLKYPSDFKDTHLRRL